MQKKVLKNDTLNLKQRVRFDKFGLLVFAVLFGLIGFYVLYRSEALPSSRTPSVLTSPGFIVNPTSKNLKRGEVLTVTVYVNSFSEPINAVQANILYSADKLQFVSINSSTSPFEVQAQSTGGNGVVKIARGHVGSLSGQQEVSKITFTALAKGSTQVTFTDGSAVVRSTDNKDILSQTIGGKYNIR
ncbi:hypothetical protein H0X09_02445 [Candidatus Saccharibacteria bacterium]|nr:hypothetical protein [Candidatus Saccharibacteria bacterium]